MQRFDGGPLSVTYRSDTILEKYLAALSVIVLGHQAGPQYMSHPVSPREALALASLTLPSPTTSIAFEAP